MQRAFPVEEMTAVFINLPRLRRLLSLSTQAGSMDCRIPFSYIFLCRFLCILAENDYKQVDIDEQYRGLKAEVLVPPSENCERYTKKGDLLTLHYNGWRAEDMTLLETR